MPSKVGCQCTHCVVISFLYCCMLLLHRAITLLEIQWVLTALRYWFLFFFFIFILQRKLFFSFYTTKSSCPETFFFHFFTSPMNSRNTLCAKFCTVVNLHSHTKNKFKANRGFDLHKTFPSTTKRVFHCVNLSLRKQMPLDATRASWTQHETQASCFNCKRQSGRVIRLRSPRSRWWATSEVKRIFSKMRFFSLSLSHSLSLSLYLPLFFLQRTLLPKQREGCYRRTLYERKRRITFVVRIFISKNYGPFEGFSTIHFGASGNPSLFDFACESTGCCASFIQSRVRLRVTTDSVGPRWPTPERETFPRSEHRDAPVDRRIHFVVKICCTRRDFSSWKNLCASAHFNTKSLVISHTFKGIWLTGTCIEIIEI